MSVNPGGTALPLHAETCNPACTNLLLNSDHKPEMRQLLRAQTSTKVNLESRYGLRSGWLPKFNWDFLVQSCISCKISIKIWSVIQRYEPNCGKKPRSQCWRIFKKNPGSRSARLQNLISSCLYSYICDKNFHEVSFGSFYVKLLTDRRMPGIA